MNIILTMSSFIFPVITFPYVSRILLPEGTGKVAFATSLISYFSMFAQLGIPTYGIRACAKVRDNRNELSKTVHELLIVNLGMCVISYVALFMALRYVPRLAEDKSLYVIMSFTIVLTSIGMEWLYKALEQYTYITCRSVIFKFIALIAMFLLEYYDGETSETEEKELKRFFTEEDVPAHLLAEKEIFMQLAAHPAPEIPEGLESRLSRKIDEWDTGERRTLKIKKHIRALRLQWIGSIAASLLILLSVGLYLYKPYPAPQDTCATPEEAYVQAQKALIMLSSSLNKGIEKVESVQEATGKIQENVNEQLNRLNNIKQ